MKGLNFSSVCEVEASIPGESKCSKIIQTVMQGLHVSQRRRRPMTFINGSQMVQINLPVTSQKMAPHHITPYHTTIASPYLEPSLTSY